jgi:opacity protein-like surface antigen
MKRTIALLAVAVLCSADASAAGPVSFGLHLNGAQTTVSGDLKDAYQFGIGGGLHADINVIPFIGVRVSGDYISFSLDNAKAREVFARLNSGTDVGAFTIDGGRLGILSFSVNGTMSLPSPVLSPYVTAGIGIASFSSSDLTVGYPGLQPFKRAGTSSGMKTAFNLGAGVDLNLAVVTLYLEVRYMWISTEETSTHAPVTLGVTF